MEKRVFENKEKCAKGLVDELILRFREIEGDIHMALSEGSTPALLFRKLANLPIGVIDWEKIHIWWVDERMVPFDHSESNYRMTRVNLIDPLKLSPSHIHRIDGAGDHSEEIQRYGREIGKYLDHSKGYPRFDIILLGMGDDGHTASIFPNQMALLRNICNCALAIHPQTGQKRVTLTGPVINNGDNIYFFVSGSSKAELIKKICCEDDVNYPAAYIKSGIFFLDSDAASLLDC